MANPTTTTRPVTDAEEAEAKLEFEERCELLRGELEAGRISEGEYEHMKAEAWEVYRVRSGQLEVDED